MDNNLEYIDDYFQNQLNSQQRQEFETRCLSDKMFAEEVAIYVSTREALRQNLLEEKKKQWSTLLPPEILTDEKASPKTTTDLHEKAPVKRMHLRKWLTLAAAACTIAALFIYPILNGDSAREDIQEYVQNELTISSTMDASRDSIQAGINAYKNKNYQDAIRIFGSIYASNPADQQTLKYLGQAYLKNRNFEDALKSFEELSQRQLRSNAGPFLMGITLMERNKPGDPERARILFQKVVGENLEGKNQAQVWLEKMN